MAEHALSFVPGPMRQRPGMWPYEAQGRAGGAGVGGDYAQRLSASWAFAPLGSRMAPMGQLHSQEVLDDTHATIRPHAQRGHVYGYVSGRV
jgi:hypothetical protein